MKILKCSGCGAYTLKRECKLCGGHALPCAPARYSPKDPYGRYRRLMKKEMEDGRHNNNAD